MSERKRLKVSHHGVKVGDLFAFIYYGKVTEVFGDNVNVEDLDNKQKFSVHGAGLIENAFSADQVVEEQKVSKTQVAEILVNSHNCVFTVCFEKQGNNEERILRGRLLNPEPLLGRSYVEDLDVVDDRPNGRMRLVDHRTIKWLTVGGIKYVTS